VTQEALTFSSLKTPPAPREIRKAKFSSNVFLLILLPSLRVSRIGESASFFAVLPRSEL